MQTTHIVQYSVHRLRHIARLSTGTVTTTLSNHHTMPITAVSQPILDHPTLGPIQGVALPSSLVQFRNIPYATIPHRFARSTLLTTRLTPSSSPASHSPYDATKPGSISIQPFNSAKSDAQGNQFPDDGDLDDEPQSEDCLNLTITAPLSSLLSQPQQDNASEKEKEKAKLPVIVFIHGGAFFLGASSRPYYSPLSLVSTSTSLSPLLFISLNYRLGALGFFHSPSSLSTSHPVPANNGLHDQLRALEWIQQHIAGFGGDPTNVTVLGQSAGGESVSLHVASGLGRELFRRAVAFSGTSVTMPAKTAGEHEENFRAQAGKLGIEVEGKSPEEVARAMQEVPVEKIRDLAWVGAPCTSSEALPDERASMRRNRSGRPDSHTHPNEWLESQIVSTTTYDGSISYIMTLNNAERKHHAAAIRKIAFDVLGDGPGKELLEIYGIQEEGVESEEVALRKICLFESDIGFFAGALSVAVGATKGSGVASDGRAKSEAEGGEKGDREEAGKAASRPKTETFLQIFDIGNPFDGPLEKGKYASHTWDIVALLGAYDDKLKTIEEASRTSNPGYKPYTTILAWRERMIRYMTSGEAPWSEFEYDGEGAEAGEGTSGERGEEGKDGYGVAMVVSNDGMSEQGPEGYLDGEDGGRRRRLLELAEKCRGEDGWDVFWEGVCRRFLMAGK